MHMAQPDLITLSGVVVVVLVNTLREHKAWAWMRLVQGPGALKGTPGLMFAKVALVCAPAPRTRDSLPSSTTPTRRAPSWLDRWWAPTANAQSTVGLACWR